jgi:hypothetical protein
MASKCIKKIMLVMMKFLILIILKVQANNLSSTSFSPSALPVLYPQSSKLDEVKPTIHTCFANGIKGCEKTWPLHNLFIHHVLGFESCLIKVHIIRWVKQHAKEEMNEEHFECIVRCAINHSNIKPCFTKCYEEHIESHIDAIYIQNP